MLTRRPIGRVLGPGAEGLGWADRRAARADADVEIGQLSYHKTMPSAVFVPVEEYLSTSYEPPCEYVDGQLIQKPMPTWQHGILQVWIAALILKLFPRFVVGSEVRTQLRTTEFRLPDILVDLPENVNSSYAEHPAYLCIEILSPEDRLGAMLEKCERYHDWGVPHCWVVDPQKRKAWTDPRGGDPAEAMEELTAGEIVLAVKDIFSRLS